jgi:hypothetical protein
VDFTRPLPVRLFKAPRTYLDFIVTSTMFRYITANQRYAIFFLFFQSFAAGGWIVAWLLTTVLGLEGISAVAIGFCLQPADRSWSIAVPIRCSRSISPPLLRSRLDTPAIDET